MADSNESKKVLIMQSSPRKKGNSATLAEEIAAGAASKGAVVESIFLHQMKIAPCQSCYVCQKKGSKGCAIDDDMQAIYPKLIEADAWVIASPVYWFNMSAQAKLFMDRCFALPCYGSNAFSGKRIGIAMSYGDADPFVSGCVNALRTFQDTFRYVGSKIVGMVYGSAMEAGEIKSNEAVMKQARELGERLPGK